MRVAAIGVAVLLAGCECNHASGQLAVVFDEHGQLVTSTVEGHFPLGPVAAGSTMQQPIVLKNIGSSPITLTSIERVSGARVAFAPPQAGEPYELEGFTPGFELSPSTVKGLELTLTAPKTSAPSLDENVTVRVHAKNGLEDQTVLLVVQAVDLGGQCLVDPVLDFGVIAAGTTRAKAIRLGNPTPETLVATLGDVLGDSAFTGPPGGLVELAPMQVVERSYTFAPQLAGDFSAKVKVKPSAACAEVVVTLRGRAVDGWVTATSNPVEFGAQSPGAVAHHGLTFANWTMQPVTLSGFQVTVEDDFAVATQELTLPPAQQQSTGTLYPGRASIDLTFSPKMLGYRTGTLGYLTDLPTQPQGSVQLEGIGGAPDVEVTPTSIDFGKIPFFVGSPHGPAGAATIEVRNRGTAPLHFGAMKWQLVGMQATDVCVGDFDPALGCLGTLTGYDDANGIAPGTALQLPVHVVASSGSPTGVGFNWTLELFTDDPDQPLTLVTLAAQYVVLPPCNFTLIPQAVDFGVVSAPSVGTQAVTIRNNGTQSTDVCVVSALQLAGGTAAAFSLPLGAMSSVTLGPGQSLVVPVRFTPQPSAQLTPLVGALEVWISSPTAPFFSVPLAGTQGDGCLQLSPLQQDFGSVALNCGAATHTFTATNICTSPVTLLSSGFAAPGDFTVVTPIPANTQLGPGASLTFALGYRGNTFGPQQNVFVVSSDEQGATRTRRITLAGNANLTGLEEDTRVQAASGKADVLFLIDNSCSMQSLQATLHQNLPELVQYFASIKADFQLGVITTDLDDPAQSGQLQAAGTNPRILDSLSPGFATMAAQNLDVGTNGSGIEHEQDAILKALQPPLSSGRNAGFVRPGAALSVIAITDFGSTADSTFIPALQALKTDGPVTFSAAKPFGTCAGSPAGNTTDQLYATLTHGVLVDLCANDWAQPLEAAVAPALQLPATMKLVSVPDLSSGGSLTVTVDGVAVAQVNARGDTVWTYDSVANAIVFDSLYVPQAGQNVTFTYPVACGP